MIDKVVPHHSYQTLLAVVLAFSVTILFDAVFSYVRQMLTLLLSNKIDARLAARTFAHLLSLPLQFFESQTAGVLLRDMQQTETIRQFLTGRLFHTLLDASALPLLLVGLLIYSVQLTLVVLGFTLAMVGVIALMLPLFRRELERLYQAEGQRQADLVETIHGMRAVKSLALEQNRMESWDVRVAGSVRRRESVGRIAAMANVLTGSLEKMMMIGILGHRGDRGVRRRTQHRRAGGVQHAVRTRDRAVGADGGADQRVPADRAVGEDAGQGDGPRAGARPEPARHAAAHRRTAGVPGGAGSATTAARRRR